MKCNEAMEGILKADLRELEGEGSTPLALHIRGCPSCRARAVAILRAEQALAQGLVKGLPEPDYDQILRRAGESTPQEDKILRIHRPPWFRPGPWKTLVPMAAAAALVFLFLGREPTLPGPVYQPPPETPGLEVDVPEGQSVAVLQTNNPDISVVWLF